MMRAAAPLLSFLTLASFLAACGGGSSSSSPLDSSGTGAAGTISTGSSSDSSSNANALGGTGVKACVPATLAYIVAQNPNYPAIDECSGHMYEKYGTEGFAAVNQNIASRALSAPTASLGTSFGLIANANTTRQTQFAAHLQQFLQTAFGDPNSYVGPDMVTAHANLAITMAQYNYFVTDVIVPALTASNVDPDDITECFAPPILNPNFIKTVVTCQ